MSLDHHALSPQAAKLNDKASTLKGFIKEVNTVSFIDRENSFLMDEPKGQMQYTMPIVKVKNIYVYWSLSTVK
ncbi:hypothetical protein PT23B2_09680 [Acinetobacter towneri]